MKPVAIPVATDPRTEREHEELVVQLGAEAAPRWPSRSTRLLSDPRSAEFACGDTGRTRWRHATPFASREA